MRFDTSIKNVLSALVPALLCLAFAATLGAGCKKTTTDATPPPDATPAEETIDTVVARSTELPANPRRIVSLAPNITEVLFAIGAGPRVVGVTRFCDFPPEVRDKAQVGGLIDPDLEAIAALEPDLVLGVTSSGSSGITSRLDSLEVPYAFLQMEDLDQTFDGIRTLGRLLGTEKAATALADEMSQDVRRFERREKLEKPPSVLMVFGRKPIVAAGPGTFADDLLTRAGGVNALAGSNEAYPQLDIEKVIELDPDRIIEIAMTPGHEDDFWTKFEGLHAVESGNVYRFEDQALMRPGPRLIDGFRKIALAIRGKHTNH